MTAPVRAQGEYLHSGTPRIDLLDPRCRFVSKGIQFAVQPGEDPVQIELKQALEGRKLSPLHLLECTSYEAAITL